MAKVVGTNVQSQTVSNYFPTLNIIAVGAILGLLFWFLNMIIGRFISSAPVASDIATILVATIGLAVMVVMRMPRPIVVILSVAVTLWGLALWTSGLTFLETLAWEVGLYAVTYALFSWLARYSKTVPLLIVATVIVATARIIVIL